MCRLSLLVCLFLLSFRGESQVGIPNAQVHSSSILELTTTAGGLVLPNIPIDSLGNQAHQEGAIAFIPDAIHPGLYLFRDNEWNRVLPLNTTSMTTITTGSEEQAQLEQLEESISQLKIAIEENEKIIGILKNQVKTK